MSEVDERKTMVTLRQDKEFTNHVAKMAEAVSAPRFTDEQVWLAMWTCVANRSNCQHADDAARWADKGLSQFRERFPSIVT